MEVNIPWIFEGMSSDSEFSKHHYKNFKHGAILILRDGIPATKRTSKSVKSTGRTDTILGSYCNEYALKDRSNRIQAPLSLILALVALLIQDHYEIPNFRSCTVCGAKQAE